MLLKIAKKEILETSREGRFRIALLVVLALLAAAAWTSKLYYSRLREAHELARANARNQWVSQDKKNPHSAAHYGTYAFKPVNPLSLIDQGVDRFAGVSIYLEAHKRNEAEYRAAQDQTGLARFGELTPDFVLLLIVPLLLILIGFNAFTRESEQGTLRLLKSQGLASWQLAAGKWLGLFLPAFVFIVISLVVSSLLLASMGPGSLDPTAVLVLLAIYAAYYAVVTNLVLAVSALARTSNMSFVILLAIWMMSSLAIPKAVNNLADTIHPYPTQVEFEKEVTADIRKGLNGHEPWSAAAQELEKKTLAEYGVDSVQQLPFNWDGFIMQKGEEHDAEIYFAHYAKLKDTFDQQSAVYRQAAVLSPFLPVRFLSMAVCGTDYHSHWRFADAAEKYRIDLVGKMNKDLMNNSRTGDWDYQADASLFASVPDFVYTPSSLSDTLKENRSNVAVLVLWFFASATVLLWSVSRLKPL